MTEEERHNREIFSRTGALYAQFLDHQDEKRADQLAAIMKKAADEEVYIAFTGHYSAGKSSLLNTLLGEDILPTSPIPTSANLVVIRHGEDKVVLHTTDGAYAEIKGSYDKEQVQQFCKDGEQIETVEVYAGFKESEPYAAYIDTPGIDSTDEAHFYLPLRFCIRLTLYFTSFIIITSIQKKICCFSAPSKTVSRICF